MKLLYSSILILVSVTAHADMITIHNETEHDIFVAIYYLTGTSNDYKGGYATRFGEPIAIAKNSYAQITRPPRHCTRYVSTICTNFKDRDLYIAAQENDLREVVAKGSLPFVNIGNTHGNTFYITEEDGRFIGYNLVTRNIRPLAKLLHHAQEKLLKKLRAIYEQHEHAHVTAMVREGSTIAPEEYSYLTQRLPRVKQALEALLNIQLTDAEVPHIAFCSSGGGYRAMIATLGSLAGAEQIGLVDACLYHAGLSGSTWALAGLLESRMPTKTYIDQLSSKINRGLLAPLTSSQASAQIAESMIKRLAFDQDISIIDLYGGLLAEQLLHGFAPNTQKITLAHQTYFFHAAEHPLPLYTALIDRGEKMSWIEFSPYEVGSIEDQVFVPSWAYGRTFQNGTSQDFSSAVSLGSCMGTWGSAISAHTQEALHAFKAQVPHDIKIFGIKVPTYTLIESLETSITQVPQIGTHRIYATKVANWMRGLNGPLKGLSQLKLIDGGFDFNLPTPPLLRDERRISVIFIFDASATTVDAPQLHKAEAYARARGLKFPKIDYTKVNTLCSIHRDDDPTVPTVIYMPLMTNKKYRNGWDPSKQKFTNTINFAYTPDEVKTLAGLTAANMIESKELILEALKDAVEKKRQRNTAQVK